MKFKIPIWLQVVGLILAITSYILMNAVCETYASFSPIFSTFHDRINENVRFFSLNEELLKDYRLHFYFNSIFAVSGTFTALCIIAFAKKVSEAYTRREGLWKWRWKRIGVLLRNPTTISYLPLIISFLALIIDLTENALFLINADNFTDNGIVLLSWLHLLLISLYGILIIWTAYWIIKSLYTILYKDLLLSLRFTYVGLIIIAVLLIVVTQLEQGQVLMLNLYFNDYNLILSPILISLTIIGIWLIPKGLYYNHLLIREHTEEYYKNKFFQNSTNFLGLAILYIIMYLQFSIYINFCEGSLTLFIGILLTVFGLNYAYYRWIQQSIKKYSVTTMESIIPDADLDRLLNQWPFLIGLILLCTVVVVTLATVVTMVAFPTSMGKESAYDLNRIFFTMTTLMTFFFIWFFSYRRIARQGSTQLPFYLEIPRRCLAMLNIKNTLTGYGFIIAVVNLFFFLLAFMAPYDLMNYHPFHILLAFANLLGAIPFLVDVMLTSRFVSARRRKRAPHQYLNISFKKATNQLIIPPRNYKSEKEDLRKEFTVTSQRKEDSRMRIQIKNKGRMYYYVIVTSVVIAIYLTTTFFSNTYHKIPFYKYDTEPQISLVEYTEDFLKTYNKERPIYFIASAGGGMSAMYFNLAVLRMLDSLSKGEFYENTFFISGISGGGLGQSIYFINKYFPDKSIVSQGQIEELGKLNILSLDLGLMFYRDVIMQFFPSILLKHFSVRDRMAVMRDVFLSHSGIKNITQLDTTPYYFLHNQLKTEGLNPPIIAMNSTRTSDALRTIVWPLKWNEEIFTGAINISRNADTYISFPDAIFLHNRFPYISPYAYIENVGYITDGGLTDNSGLLGVIQVLNYMQKNKEVIPEFHALLNHNIQVIYINFSTSSFIKSKYFREYHNDIDPATISHNYSNFLSSVTSTSLSAIPYMLKNYMYERDSMLTFMEFNEFHIPYKLSYNEIQKVIGGQIADTTFYAYHDSLQEEVLSIYSSLCNTPPPLGRYLGKTVIEYINATVKSPRLQKKIESTLDK